MINIKDGLLSRESTVALVGLGYVGLPIAVAFAKKGVAVIGFDVSQKKIARLKENQDITGELTPEDLQVAKPHITYTCDASELSKAQFIIVAVPTPIGEYKTPDLTPLESASTIIGKHLKRGATVIYESTVYPGVTEEYCVPIIEKVSGLSWKNGDFFVGYSPERINPGDKQHSLASVVKVVSGQNKKICDEVAQLYEIVVEAGVYRAESIKVAEAAKVIENTQRDLNIALMNELAIIFQKIGISTEAVLKAAGTKWNFLKFHPGLVGGHCIGVDPYYLTSKAEQLGYHPQVVLAGRRINDSMGAYVGQETVKQMIKAKTMVEGANVLVLGLTFKENVPDFRNSKVFDIINEMKSFGAKVLVSDPFSEVFTPDGDVELVDWRKTTDIDAVIVATAHDVYREIPLKELKSICRKSGGQPVLTDVRWIYRKEDAEKAGFSYWRL